VSPFIHHNPSPEKSREFDQARKAAAELKRFTRRQKRLDTL